LPGKRLAARRAGMTTIGWNIGNTLTTLSLPLSRPACGVLPHENRGGRRDRRAIVAPLQSHFV